MSPEQRNELIDALIERIPDISCPICHGKSFTIADGFALNPLQEGFQSFTMTGEKMIPSIYMICNNCGFMSQHALGLLKLIKLEVKEE